VVAGLLVAVAMQFLAGPIAHTVAPHDPAVADGARIWLRIAACGVPGLMLATAGHGWLRGIQELKAPVRYTLAANGLSAVLCPILVYPLGFGLAGSAVANVMAQAVGGFLFVRALVRRARSLRPHGTLIRAQLVAGRDLLVRGAAFQACFLSATAIAARFGTPVLGAHQIALQLWLFAAFALDALAIAAQTLVGAALGGGDQAQARDLAWRIARMGLWCGLAFGAVVLAGIDVLPRVFTDDAAVVAQTRHAWFWFAAMQPLAGVVFAIDGILIGAGDLRYMRNLTIVAALGFLPALWLAYGLHAGLGGIWAGLTLFIVIRFVAGVGRLRGTNWAPVGATR
jgi:putative MATE family efflux protein